MIRDAMLKTLGREYRACLKRSEKAFNCIEGTKPKNQPSWIGFKAEHKWLRMFAKHTGILRRSVGIDPASAVSHQGDPRRTDAIATLVGGEAAQFELKKSDYGGKRVEYQLSAQLFDLGLGTYGAETLNVIYGENGRIDIYTRKQGEQMVSAAMKRNGTVDLPSPAKVIEFGRDVSGSRMPATKTTSAN